MLRRAGSPLVRPPLRAARALGNAFEDCEQAIERYDYHVAMAPLQPSRAHDADDRYDPGRIASPPASGPTCGRRGSPQVLLAERARLGLDRIADAVRRPDEMITVTPAATAHRSAPPTRCRPAPSRHAGPLALSRHLHASGRRGAANGEPPTRGRHRASGARKPRARPACSARRRPRPAG